MILLCKEGTDGHLRTLLVNMGVDISYQRKVVVCRETDLSAKARERDDFL